jgi:peptidoglycan hydrolase-like protein with peptidoglycan-binding domain
MRRLLAGTLGILALACVLAVFPRMAPNGAWAQRYAAGDTSAVEITFWNSIKDSTDPEEFKAYLDTFPDGRFAALARVRLKKLEEKRQEATGPKPPTAPLAEAVVREVQELLYNLNYAITAINGKLTPEVTTAIRSLQGKLGDPATGELTEAQLNRLRRIEVPKVWGAIAASRNGRIEVSWGLATRREAEAKVLLGCAPEGAAECKIFSIAGKQCAVAASSREPSSDGKAALRITVSRQTGLEPTEAAALAACNRDAKSQPVCRVIGKVCANGGHASAKPQRGGGGL